MTEQDLLVIKAGVNRIVRILCCDGEVIVAKIHAISDEDQDVICDLLSTSRPDKYEKYSEQPALLIKLVEIDHVEPLYDS